MKIEIKSIFGSVIFEYECENNTMLKTLLKSLESDANLGGANLRGANLDFSCLHFSCKSRKPKTDERQRIQLAHHFLSWIKYSDNATYEEKQIFEQLKNYAKRFHRDDVEKF